MCCAITAGERMSSSLMLCSSAGAGAGLLCHLVCCALFLFLLLTAVHVVCCVPVFIGELHLVRSS